MRQALTWLLLFVFAGSAGAEPPTPLLWKISDKDNSVYLLGSFHMLKETDYPLSADVDQAFADSNEVLFELHPNDLADPAAIGQKMLAAARFDDGRDLTSVLPPETLAALSAYLQSRGIPLAALQSFRPWFVSLSLTVMEYQAMGIRSDLGLDAHFVEKVLARGTPTGGLETIDDQIGVFTAMSDEASVDSIKQFLEDLPQLKSQMNELHGFWRSGDENAINASMADEFKQYPELYAAMLVDRNQKWLPKIRARLDQNDQDNALIIVGAMHLLGDDGLVHLLQQSGYRVERMCSACVPKPSTAASPAMAH